MLSKSQYLRGLQCAKSLWLYRHRPELRTPPDDAQQAVFASGTEVGLLARTLFPGGAAVEYEGSTFEQKVSKTRDLIAAGTTTLYEATFVHDGILVMVDILRRGLQGWELYEVKSSTTVKPVHIPDAAVQRHVVSGCGLPVVRTSLVHINSGYVRRGELNARELFTVSDQSAAAENLGATVRENVRRMRDLIGGECPAIDIGPHCNDPYDCDFSAHCRAHLPSPSVFDLARLGSARKFELYYSGVRAFQDIPPSFPLTTGQRMQVEAELHGRRFADRPGIARFLAALHYPLYFLDFETFQSAVPLFDETGPYAQIPFQYSLHAIDREAGPVGHAEFLGDGSGDPREALARQLISDVPADSCVLAYNMAFEKSVLRALARRFPALGGALMNIHDNMLDLMEPFRKNLYYVKEMRGSYSIKSVLPALVPELDYANLTIGNGGEAMAAYAALRRTTAPEEAARLRRDLLEYCRLDTLAMVKLLGKLREAAAE